MTTTEEAIERALAVAPPFTAAQIRRLSGLLRTGNEPQPYRAPEPKPETPAERDRRLGAELTERLSACANCGISEERHKYPEGYGYISHGHVSLSLTDRKRITDKFLEEHNG